MRVIPAHFYCYTQYIVYKENFSEQFAVEYFIFENNIIKIIIELNSLFIIKYKNMKTSRIWNI